MDNKKIGQFISERRKDLGLTQQQLAEHLGVSNKAISKWETGEGYPDITIVLELSKALGVTADELLRGEMVQSTNTPSCIKTENANPVNNVYMSRKNKHTRKMVSLRSIVIITGILLFAFTFSLDGSITLFEEIKILVAFITAIILVVGGFFLEASHMNRAKE